MHFASTEHCITSHKYSNIHWMIDCPCRFVYSYVQIRTACWLFYTCCVDICPCQTGEEPDILLQVQIFNNTTPRQVITAVNSTCKAPQDREQSILTERRNASGNQVPSSPTVSAPPPPHTHMYMHIHTHARTDHLQHKVLL